MTRIEERIVDYYDSCEIDYRLFWDLDNSLAIHYGYWDETTKTFPQSLKRFNAVLAERAGVTARDRVLDAGCGVGGSSIFLAKAIGCQVVGITLSQRQVVRATTHAKRNDMEHLVTFLRGNYLHTSFHSASFDVVWALESVCYADNKQQFVREAARLLRPGGRLILADGFASQSNYAKDESTLMRSWLSPWAVDFLETSENFMTYLSEAGFKNISFSDVTKNILPSSWRLYLLSLVGIPTGKISYWLGMRTKMQTANLFGAHYQYKALRRGLWKYGIVYAEK